MPWRQSRRKEERVTHVKDDPDALPLSSYPTLSWDPSSLHSSPLSFLGLSWRHLTRYSSTPEIHMSTESSWFTVGQGNVLLQSLEATCFWECHGNTFRHLIRRPRQRIFSCQQLCFLTAAEKFPTPGKIPSWPSPVTLKPLSGADKERGTPVEWFVGMDS